MRKLLLTIMLMVPLTAVAADESIMFELGFGIGNASGGRTDGNDNAKFCKNRNQGRMVFAAVRYTQDDVEVHAARWFHDDGNAPRCDRDTWAAGLGYVIDTQGDGKAGTDDVYASWTPGFVYTWGEDKEFTGQDADNTNWRQTGNWQTFNRFAIGTGDNNGAAELAVHRYGTWNPEHGEYFATVGTALRDLDNSKSTRGLTQPNAFNIIVEENTNSAPPSESTASLDVPDDGSQYDGGQASF